MSSKTTQDFFEEQKFISLKTKAIKSGGVSIVAQMISLAIHMLGVIILARMLQPRDFGLVTMVTAFYLLLMNFGINGFTEFIIQKKTISHMELSTIFWLHAFISSLLMLGFIGAAPILAAFYNEPEIKRIAMVMSFGIIAQMLSTHHLALLKRKMEFVKLAVNRVMAGVISLVIAVVMAQKGFGYWAVVARQLSHVVLIGIGSWVMCPWRPGLPGKFQSVVGSLKYALHVYGNFILGYFSRNLDKILLGRFYGSKVLGNYDRAYHLTSTPTGQLVTPLHSVGLATLSRLIDTPDRYIRYYTKALCMLSFVGVWASLVLTLSGKDIIFLLLGHGWERAGIVVMAFGPGIGAMILYSTYSWIHLSLAKPDRWLRWSLVSLGFTVAFLFASAPFGPVYIAGAYSISYYVLLAPAIWYAGRPIGLKVIPIGKAIGPYFVSGAASFSILFAGTEFFTVTSSFIETLSPVLRLSIMVSSSIIIYTALVVAFHRSFDPVKDLFNFVRTFIQRDKTKSS